MTSFTVAVHSVAPCSGSFVLRNVGVDVGKSRKCSQKTNCRVHLKNKSDNIKKSSNCKQLSDITISINHSNFISLAPFIYKNATQGA